MAAPVTPQKGRKVPLPSTPFGENETDAWEFFKNLQRPFSALKITSAYRRQADKAEDAEMFVLFPLSFAEMVAHVCTILGIDPSETAEEKRARKMPKSTQPTPMDIDTPPLASRSPRPPTPMSIECHLAAATDSPAPYTPAHKPIRIRRPPLPLINRRLLPSRFPNPPILSHQFTDVSVSQGAHPSCLAWLQLYRTHR